MHRDQRFAGLHVVVVVDAVVQSLQMRDAIALLELSAAEEPHVVEALAAEAEARRAVVAVKPPHRLGQRRKDLDAVLLVQLRQPVAIVLGLRVHAVAERLDGLFHHRKVLPWQPLLDAGLGVQHILAEDLVDLHANLLLWLSTKLPTSAIEVQAGGHSRQLFGGFVDLKASSDQRLDRRRFEIGLARGPFEGAIALECR